MVNVSIDVTDLGGEARPGDKVVFWRPRMGGSATHAGRVISTAPVTVFLTNGKATVSNVEPGEMTVLLQCRGVESQGPVTVGVPDGNGTVTLRSLIESQFEYAPPIVSAVQEAAANASASERAAIEAQVRSEAAADRADAKVDDAINNGANLVRGEVKQDADRAVAARQAAVQSETSAKASESAAATSESNAAASESAAKTSETNAGDYAAVATTAATEAVDAMESASFTVDEAVGLLEGQLEESYAKRSYVDEYLSELKIENLEDRHLDDVRGLGRYTQIFTNKAIASKGYPVTGVRVNLFVYPINANSSSQVMQTLVVRDTGDIYVRSYVGGWGEWAKANSGVLNLGTTHLNDVLTPGYYAQPLAGNVTKDKGYPIVGGRITLKVERINENSASQIVQTVTSITTGETFIRLYVSGWGGWSKVGGESFFRGVVTRSTLDEITDWTAPEASGAWTVTNPTNAAAMGLPEEATARGSLFNLTAGNKGAEIRQRIFITTDGDLWTQHATSSGYTDWTKKETSTSTISAGDGGGGAVAAYDTMLRGRGRIGTGGRPVVAFRFDHSAKPFIEKVLPVLKEYGLPATFPCFVDMMDPQPGYNSDVSTGYTWQDVQDCFYNGVEVFSHSWSHQDATTVEGIEKEIRESRFTLEENMPDVLVHGWANPGVPNAYNGYWGGDSRHHVKMGLNYAGQLITNTYACFNTNKSGVTQLGSQDLAHRTIEGITSLDTLKSRVDDAVRTSSAAVLMLHPNQLDNEGRISLALFDELCAWVASERDAGRLDVLTMSGVALADPSTDYRHNLAPALSAWSKSGDTYSATVPVYFVPFAGGSTRQVRVVCSQDTTVSVQVSATGAPMDVSRTVQALAGVPAFVPVGIPRRATDIEVTVTGAGVQDIRLESV